MAIMAIVRQTRISRNAVRWALASGGPPVYLRPASGSVVAAAEPQIRELLRETLTMPATVIVERIGWQNALPWHSSDVAYSNESVNGHVNADEPIIPERTR
jgi:hypothetical protein